MKPFSTVSWIVTFPSQYKAQLRFANVSQPKCAETHTFIRVKELNQEAELISRSENEEPIEDLAVPRSFYLNMSNCEPETGRFAAMTQIVLQKKTRELVVYPDVLSFTSSNLISCLFCYFSQICWPSCWDCWGLFWF